MVFNKQKKNHLGVVIDSRSVFGAKKLLNDIKNNKFWDLKNIVSVIENII